MTDFAVSPLAVRSRSAGAWRPTLIAAAIAVATATHANAARAPADATGEAEAAGDSEAGQTQTGATVLPAVRVEAEAKDPAVTEGSRSYVAPSATTATGLRLSPRDTRNPCR